MKGGVCNAISGVRRFPRGTGGAEVSPIGAISLWDSPTWESRVETRQDER
jgi:hypothetical protein